MFWRSEINRFLTSTWYAKVYCMLIVREEWLCEWLTSKAEEKNFNKIFCGPMKLISVTTGYSMKKIKLGLSIISFFINLNVSKIVERLMWNYRKGREGI